MSNVCMYGMFVNGEDTSINKFVSYMKGNEDKTLVGVNTNEVEYLYYNGRHIVNGGCNHSMQVSMSGMTGSYFESEHDKTSYTTLEKITEELELRIEATAFGEDEEELIIDNGKVLLHE